MPPGNLIHIAIKHEGFKERNGEGRWRGMIDKGKEGKGRRRQEKQVVKMKRRLRKDSHCRKVQ